MNINKIESILDTLGYLEGEIESISINDTKESGIDISFHVNKAAAPQPNVAEVKVLNYNETFGDFCKRLDETKKAEKESTDDDYVPSRCRSTWKTPVPQIRTRNVYFKSKDRAEDFIKSYESDFEIPKSESRPGVKKFVLKRNTTEDGLFSMGYQWLLSFCMNGASFEVIENLEKLQKSPYGKAGGHCVRLKEEI